MTDTRPAECRFRLQDEAKPYPRSSCRACGKNIKTGLGTTCTVPPMMQPDIAPPQSDATPIDHVAALLAQGWTKRDDGTLVPPDPLACAREFVADMFRRFGLIRQADDVDNGTCDITIKQINDRYKIDKLPPAP